jgi:hypothetical protein
MLAEIGGCLHSSRSPSPLFRQPVSGIRTGRSLQVSAGYRDGGAVAGKAGVPAAQASPDCPRRERQLEASRANLRKAWQASHDPANQFHCHAHRRKHNLCTRRPDHMIWGYLEMREEADRRRALQRAKRHR